MATFGCVAQKVASAAQLLLLLASLHAVACFNDFASIPAFDGVHTVLAVLLLLSFLLLLNCVPAIVSGLDIAVILNVTWVELLLLLVSLLLLAS